MAFYRRTTILIEVEVKGVTPFGSAVYVTPENGVTITIKDSNSNIVVNNQSMMEETTGKFSYKWQTILSLSADSYSIEVLADDASWNGFTKEIGIILN